MSDYRPYTYVVGAVHDGITRLGVSFYSAELSVIAMTFQDVRPYLLFGTPEGEVSISTTGGGPVTTADLALAREIAGAAARYRDECERLYANRSPDPDQADENAA